MKLLNMNGIQDYLALLVRRKWWVVIPFFALSGAVLVITYLLPKMFVSETLILIRPRDVPEEFVKDLLAGTTEQRLTAIEQTVLSRTNLIQILREFEDKLPEYRALNMDDKVLKLSGKIKIDFQQEKRTNPQLLQVTYFRISYQNLNPELAQKITAKLSSLFIEQDNRSRESQVFGTTEFLSAELEKVAEERRQSDAKLKELRARRQYELPDQLETNLRTLDRLGLQKQAVAEALDRSSTMRLNLERMLSETEPTIPRPTPPGTRLAVKSTLLEEYRKKQMEVKTLTALYKAKHPDVEAATRQLERLKKDLSAEDLAALESPGDEQAGPEVAGSTMPNPLYQNLTSQLEEIKTEFDIRERGRKQIEADIATYTKRVQAAPQSEQEIAEVLRQNTDLNKQYEILKKNLSEAKLSESLESRQRGSQFTTVDPANYPLTPTKPDKLTIAVVGILLSMAASIVVAVLADIANQKMWTQSDIEHILGATVLVEIPEIVTDSDVVLARKKKRAHVVSFMAAAAAYTFCLYLLYTHQTAVLRHLDPFIQRLY